MNTTRIADVCEDIARQYGTRVDAVLYDRLLQVQVDPVSAAISTEGRAQLQACLPAGWHVWIEGRLTEARPHMPAGWVYSTPEQHLIEGLTVLGHYSVEPRR